LGNLTINFIFNNLIIGELQICYGRKPVFYSENHFLYELARADSVAQFTLQLSSRINSLSEQGNLYRTIIDFEAQAKRENEILEELGIKKAKSIRIAGLDG